MVKETVWTIDLLIINTMDWLIIFYVLIENKRFAPDRYRKSNIKIRNYCQYLSKRKMHWHHWIRVELLTRVPVLLAQIKAWNNSNKLKRK